jgi:hypothetical protein
MSVIVATLDEGLPRTCHQLENHAEHVEVLVQNLSLALDFREWGCGPSPIIRL